MFIMAHNIMVVDDDFWMIKEASFVVPAMLMHVACSPHVHTQAICTTQPGSIFEWTPDGGVLPLGNTMPPQRWRRSLFSR
jgi:hypothetical protein